jgi:hypothetical protein
LRAVAKGYTLNVRREGGGGKERFDTLIGALDALELEARAFANTEKRDAAMGILRTYEPGDLVALRAEITGKGVHAGVDVRGDGSAEAFTGRVQRRLVAQQPRESPYDALRRVLGC